MKKKWNLTISDVLKTLNEIEKNPNYFLKKIKELGIRSPRTHFIIFKNKKFGVKQVVHFSYYLKYRKAMPVNEISSTYSNFLSKFNTSEFYIERPEIRISSNTNFKLNERVKREILARQGQSSFRKTLLQAYNYKCCVTGSTILEILEASHINAYSKSEDNCVNNGLILRTDIHTLFDRGLIKIGKNYKLQINKELSNTEYSIYDGKKVSLPKNKEHWPKT